MIDKILGFFILLTSSSIRNFMFADLGIEEFNKLLFLVSLIPLSVLIIINANVRKVKSVKASTNHNGFLYYLVPVLAVARIVYYFYQTWYYMEIKVVVLGFVIFCMTTVGLSLLLLPQETELRNE